jgi:hypothetical protein
MPAGELDSPHRDHTYYRVSASGYKLGDSDAAAGSRGTPRRSSPAEVTAAAIS